MQVPAAREPRRRLRRARQSCVLVVRGGRSSGGIFQTRRASVSVPRRALGGCTGRCTGQLIFTSKAKKRLLALFVDSENLDAGEVHVSSTTSGAFDNQPGLTTS